jgi:hypothetical protein
MAVIPIGYAQVNFKWGGAGFPTGAECTFGVGRGSTSTPEEDAVDIRDITLTRLSDRIPSTVTLSSILVKYGPNTTGPFHELGVAEAGTGSSGDVNPNVAMLIRKTTSLGGRKGRGRWYWPVAEDQVGQAGVLKTSPDQVTAMNEALALWLGDMATNDHTVYLLHNHPDDAPNIVTALSTQATTATQRRRLRR